MIRALSEAPLAAAAPQHLPGVLHSLEPALDHYGYLAVAGFVMLEDFGIPVPGETILILGAVYAGTGRLNVVAVAIVGFIAAVLGDNIGFTIGHFGGRPLIERSRCDRAVPPSFAAAGTFAVPNVAGSQPNNASTETSIRVSGSAATLSPDCTSVLPVMVNRPCTVSVRNREAWPMP
jgi:hypothetical protein